MNKQIRYRIYGVLDLEPGDSIDEVLDKIRETGNATILDVKLVSTDDAFPDVDADFKDFVEKIKAEPKA